MPTCFVILDTTSRYSEKSMFSPSELPIASATGWLPTVSATNPASSATRALHVSHTVGSTMRRLDSWASARASARFFTSGIVNAPSLSLASQPTWHSGCRGGIRRSQEDVGEQVLVGRAGDGGVAGQVRDP